MTGDILLVDWLGRGGIAQTTAAWVLAIIAAGGHPTIVTRQGSDLAGLPGAVAVGTSGGRLRTHRRLARAAAVLIERRSYEAVVVQNYLIPPVEAVIWRAAARRGTRAVFAVHNHRPHARRAGSRARLTDLLRRSDDLVFHSDFVATAVRGKGTARVHVLPLPPAPGAIGADLNRSSLIDPGSRWAVHFGITGRSYKGGATVEGVARLATGGGWRVAVAGASAVAPSNGVAAPGYLDDGVLWDLVGSAEAALLPYRAASQSAAVLLAQALGTVPLTSRVGGISEQVLDGTDGFLLPADAPPRAWLDRMEALEDPRVADKMGHAARARGRRAADGFGRLAPKVLA